MRGAQADRAQADRVKRRDVAREWEEVGEWSAVPDRGKDPYSPTNRLTCSRLGVSEVAPLKL